MCEVEMVAEFPSEIEGNEVEAKWSVTGRTSPAAMENATDLSGEGVSEAHNSEVFGPNVLVRVLKRGSHWSAAHDGLHEEMTTEVCYSYGI